MEIDQLKALVSLAKTKNFSKTAESLHVVQSSISMRINHLEDYLGRRLFERDNRKVELTSAGRALVPYAERVLSLLKEAETTIRFEEHFVDHIVLGSTDSIWRHLLRQSLLKFCRSNPKIAVSTKTGHSHEITQFLLDGVIHIGFVYSRPHLPGLRVFSFYDDEVILVASADHPVTKVKTVSRKDLAELPFITINWDGPIQDWIDRVLPKTYTPQVRLDQLSMLKVFIKNGEGIGFLPKWTVTEELKKKELVEIKVKDLPSLKRKGYVIFKREKEIRPAIQLWLNLLKENGFRLVEST